MLGCWRGVLYLDSQAADGLQMYGEDSGRDRKWKRDRPKARGLAVGLAVELVWSDGGREGSLGYAER